MALVSTFCLLGHPAERGNPYYLTLANTTAKKFAARKTIESTKTRYYRRASFQIALSGVIGEGPQLPHTSASIETSVFSLVSLCVSTHMCETFFRAHPAVNSLNQYFHPIQHNHISICFRCAARICYIQQGYIRLGYMDLTF